MKKTSFSRHLSSLGLLFFLVIAVLMLPAGPNTGPYRALATMFGSIVLEALPFMLLGALIGGLIEALVSRERMAALLPANPLVGVCVSAGLGILFPVCECAVVPVVRRLLGKGLPFSAAIAYLLAGPVVNPIVAASTLLAYGFDWSVAAWRLGLAYVVAVGIALFLGRLFPGRTALLEEQELASTPQTACSCGCETDLLPRFEHVHSIPMHPTFSQKLMQALRHGAADFLGTAHFLVIGAFVAALAQTFVNRSLLLDFAVYPALATLLMSGLAVALNLCSEADAFIAASFRGLVPLQGQMAFMLTGPMFDLKLLLMYQVLFRRKTIAALSSLILLATMAAAQLCTLWRLP